MSKEKQILGDLIRLSRLLFELEDTFSREEVIDFISAGRNSWDCTDEEIVAKLIAWKDGEYVS